MLRGDLAVGVVWDEAVVPFGGTCLGGGFGLLWWERGSWRWGALDHKTGELCSGDERVRAVTMQSIPKRVEP